MQMPSGMLIYQNDNRNRFESNLAVTELRSTLITFSSLQTFSYAEVYRDRKKFFRDSSVEGRLGINVLIRQCRKSVWSTIVIIISSRKLFYLHVLANGCKTWPRIQREDRKIGTFQDVTFVGRNQGIGETHCLHIQGRISIYEVSEIESTQRIFGARRIAFVVTDVVT